MIDKFQNNNSFDFLIIISSLTRLHICYHCFRWLFDHLQHGCHEEPGSLVAMRVVYLQWSYTLSRFISVLPADDPW